MRPIQGVVSFFNEQLAMRHKAKELLELVPITEEQFQLMLDFEYITRQKFYTESQIITKVLDALAREKKAPIKSGRLKWSKPESRDREKIIMLRGAGFSVDKIAKILGIGESTVKRRLKGRLVAAIGFYALRRARIETLSEKKFPTEEIAEILHLSEKTVLRYLKK